MLNTKTFIKHIDKKRSDAAHAAHLQFKYIKRQPIAMSHEIQSDAKQMSQCVNIDVTKQIRNHFTKSAYI